MCFLSLNVEKVLLQKKKVGATQSIEFKREIVRRKSYVQL